MISGHMVKRLITAIVIGLATFLVLIWVPQEIQIPLGFAILASIIKINGWRDWRYEGRGK